jgi:putative addiction module component (TIGR02574 family)
MTAEAETLFQTALKLPERERAELAAKLIDSIDPDTEDDCVAAWDVEIAKRLDELDQGKVETIPWTEARQIIAGTKDAGRQA